MKSIFRFFAERHILASLIVLMIILMGASTLLTIKRDSYPEADYGRMNIMTVYPGASPEDVELNVTNKIEDELKSVTGIERMTSFSMENVSVVDVVLDVDAKDQEDIKTEIREAIGRVPDFPSEVTESPEITEIKVSLIPVMEVGLTGDIPYAALRERARLFEKKLEAVPGVTKVERMGYRAREIRVEVSPDAIDKYQIPMHEIISAIQARNIRGTTGTFESYTSEKDLVTLAQFRNPLEVGDVIIRSSFDGPQVRVRDLAVVRDDFEDEKVFSKIGDNRVISFVVSKSESADLIRTASAIKNLIREERKNQPEGVEILFTNDYSRYVSNRFEVVLSNGLIGFLLVILILPVFLNFRTAFWVAMGIPVAFLGTIFLLPLFDVYLDSLTLSGMILVLGIIVDDAIIISENIKSRREMGDSPIDAAVNGINEVFKPVLTTVLTTFLVFAPMFFMSGTMGKFVFVLPLSISLALFISLGESMIALPAHLAHGMQKHKDQNSIHKWFNAMAKQYQKLLHPLLKLRYLLVLVFILLLFGSAWYGTNKMQFILMPSDMAEQFYMYLELPTGTPLNTTCEKLKEVETIVQDLPEEELVSYSSQVGVNYLNEFIFAESENCVAMTVDLTPFSKRKRTADQIVEQMRRRTSQLEGFKKISYHIETGGPPVGKPINIRIVGSDDGMRQVLADSVEVFLTGFKGVKDIRRDDVPGKDQVEIRIDYSKLSRMGLTVADVAQSVRIAYDGEVVTSVRYGEEDVNLRVILQEKERKRLNHLKELPIPNRQGRLIHLDQVASLKSGPGPSDFRHYNGERCLTITGDVEKDAISPIEVTQAVATHFNLDQDWPGLRFVFGGEAMETGKSMISLFQTMLIAVIGIYFLLVLLFNSLTQPFLVMAAIPFGITGVIIAFAMHGEPFGFMSVMGIIGLSGVVVNDSLVLVSHLNELRQQRSDEPLIQLVAEGTSDRLRAIIMTTLTTVVALLPLAYGFGGTDPWMAPMALALGWGLLFATPLTLGLVPCLYMIGQDLGKLLSKIEPS